MAAQASKLTVSIPANLLSVADRIAREKKVSRSKLVTLCLQQMADKYLQEQMAEGYRVMADEQKNAAKLTFQRQSDIVPEWK